MPLMISVTTVRSYMPTSLDDVSVRRTSLAQHGAPRRQLDVVVALDDVDVELALRRRDKDSLLDAQLRAWH